MSKQFCVAATLFAFSAFIPLGAAANVLFSNFAASDGFNSFTGRVIGEISGRNNPPGYTFVPTQSGALDFIDLAVSIGSGNDIDVNLRAVDSCPGDFASVNCFGGGVPGEVLGSWSLTGPATPSVLTVDTSASGLSLQAGTAYFVQLTTETPSPSSTWWQNSQGHKGDLFQCAGGDCSSFTAFANVDTGATRFRTATQETQEPGPVPAPAVALLMLAGVASILTKRR